MVPKVNSGANVYGVLQYNRIKVEAGEGRILYMQGIPERSDGRFSIEECAEAFGYYKVVSSALHEGREFLDLRAADRCLKVCRFQVIAEMGVYIFVVIAERKFSVLSVETMSAHIVMSGRADAVAAPVAERADDLI